MSAGGRASKGSAKQMGGSNQMGQDEMYIFAFMRDRALAPRLPTSSQQAAPPPHTPPLQ